ncbi:MAG: hypothetical protein JWN78_1909 [Bacteroidota bacterium]|nr:hypothetical protein [Bacteroidota bacterium]
MKRYMRTFKIVSIITMMFVFNNSKAIDANGYYVTLKNDTIHAKFKIPYYPNISIDLNYLKLQEKIEVYADKKEKQELLPGDILAFSFYYTNEDLETDTVTYVSRKNTLKLGREFFQSDSAIFLRLMIKGKLSLYKYYSMGSMPAGNMGMSAVGVAQEASILEKNEKLYMYNAFKFRSDIEEYLSDCPAVVKLIEEKKYKSKHLSTIVQEYNRLCGQ